MPNARLDSVTERIAFFPVMACSFSLSAFSQAVLTAAISLPSPATRTRDEQHQNPRNKNFIKEKHSLHKLSNSSSRLPPILSVRGPEVKGSGTSLPRQELRARLPYTGISEKNSQPSW